MAGFFDSLGLSGGITALPLYDAAMGLLLAFILPSELLLLDEVTTDLDVLARQSLLEFLKEENERRGVTVLFSTHIFDGLEEWGTQVTYVRDGTVMTNTELAGMAELEPFKAQGSLTPLFHFVEATVRKDSETARAAGRKSTRGLMGKLRDWRDSRPWVGSGSGLSWRTCWARSCSTSARMSR